MKERKPYDLGALHTLLEKIRLDEEDTLNFPSAFLCLVNEIIDLTTRIEYLESKIEEGMSLGNGEFDEKPS